MQEEPGPPLDKGCVDLSEPCRATSGFDYTNLDPQVGRFLRVQAQQIRRSLGRSTMQIGRELNLARQRLPHGGFTRWVEAEVGIPARTAQGYMRVAYWAEHKSPKIGQLPLSLLYLLSTPATPKEVVAGVIERVEAGAAVSTHEVRAHLKEARRRRRAASCESSSGSFDSSIDRDRIDRKPLPDRAHVHLSEAMEVIVRGLSPNRLERFSTILASRSLRDDPAFAVHLKEAFLRVDQIGTRHDATRITLRQTGQSKDGPAEGRPVRA